MSNPSKQKGTAAETALVRWLQAHGHDGARRNPPGGAKDVGDIGGVVGWDMGWARMMPTVIEVKSVKDLARGINEGLAELEVEKANLGAAHGVLVIKRRGKTDPGEWLAVRRVCDDPELGRGGDGMSRVVNVAALVVALSVLANERREAWVLSDEIVEACESWRYQPNGTAKAYRLCDLITDAVLGPEQGDQ